MTQAFPPSNTHPLSQEDRELAQALRVQAMSDAERSTWLVSTWGALQRQSAIFNTHALPHPPRARSYASMEEKNRFDEERELQFAMQHSLFAHASQPVA
jgi:hypothetical protein